MSGQQLCPLPPLWRPGVHICSAPATPAQRSSCHVQVVWDRSGANCALLYPRSLTILQCAAKVSVMTCRVELSARGALWWNACLIVDTWRDIRIIFPSGAQYSSLILCSAEVLPCVTHLSSSPLEDMGPGSPGNSPPDLSSRSSRISGTFSSRSSAISAAESKIYRASFEVASVFKRRALMPEESAGDALPTPAPCGLPGRSARNYASLRPPGLLTLVEIVDVNLYVMDSDSTLHSICIGTGGLCNTPYSLYTSAWTHTFLHKPPPTHHGSCPGNPAMVQ